MKRSISGPRQATRWGIGRKAIIVLGMHRSGTSALTRVLSLCGASLPARLMKPAEGNNSTGFWEPQKIVELHDEVLASAGLSWDDPSDFPTAWFETSHAASIRTRVIEEFQTDFGDAPLVVVKDPRMCRLIPLWLSVFSEMGIEPSIVISVRNPLEVAASLSARDRMPLHRGLLLWRQHFLAAERDSRSTKRSFVAYGDFVEDWRAMIDRIGSDLDIAWPDRGATSDREIDGFLQNNLRHHILTDDNLHSQSNGIAGIEEAYIWAVRACGGERPDPAILDNIGRTIHLSDWMRSIYLRPRFRYISRSALRAIVRRTSAKFRRER